MSNYNQTRGSYEEGFTSYHSGGRDNANDFNRLSQAIGSNIQKITQNVSSVQRMVGQIGTSRDSEHLREELHKIEHYTNQLAKDTNKQLRDMVNLSAPASSSEQRQRKMQREKLTDDFSKSLNNFQVALRKAAEKEKESIRRARVNSGYGPTDFEGLRSTSDDQLIDIGRSSTSQTQQVLQMEEDVNLQLIQEREESVKKLESDIIGLNDIFKELGMLVHEQGEVIDSIEANVENAQIHVQEGNTQLEKARDYQSSARRKKCILVLILLAILIVIGVIIGIVYGTKSGGK
ncbi:syntaxin-7-like [Tubulanus polymorphus]|uniref:syntaxin-7-like n=1 Tax=Tubulanus polymorphus TaxID=672921 RepID=UPI003DA69483